MARLVTLTIDPLLGTIEIEGLIYAGDTPIVRMEGVTWPIGETTRLTIKRGDEIITKHSVWTTISETILESAVPLAETSWRYDQAGCSVSVSSFTDTVRTTHGRVDWVVKSPGHDATDSDPVGPSENTYTDAEVQALVTGRPYVTETFLTAESILRKIGTHHVIAGGDITLPAESDYAAGDEIIISASANITVIGTIITLAAPLGGNITMAAGTRIAIAANGSEYRIYEAL